MKNNSTLIRLAYAWSAVLGVLLLVLIVGWFWKSDSNLNFADRQILYLAFGVMALLSAANFVAARHLVRAEGLRFVRITAFANIFLCVPIGTAIGLFTLLRLSAHSDPT